MGIEYPVPPTEYTIYTADMAGLYGNLWSVPGASPEGVMGRGGSLLILTLNNIGKQAPKVLKYSTLKKPELD